METPGAKIYASNHTSYFDVVALMLGLGVPYRFVAKMEVARMPFIGTFMRQMGHLSFDRADAGSRLHQAAEMEDFLRKGESVFVFPEGTFTREAGVHQFQLGAFKAAVETGAPVIPVSLRGTREFLPDGALFAAAFERDDYVVGAGFSARSEWGRFGERLARVDSFAGSCAGGGGGVFGGGDFVGGFFGVGSATASARVRLRGCRDQSKRGSSTARQPEEKASARSGRNDSFGWVAWRVARSDEQPEKVDCVMASNSRFLTRLEKAAGSE